MFQTGLLCALVLSFGAHTPAQQQRGGGAGTAKPAVVVPAGKPTVFLWPNGAPGSETRKDEAEGVKGETVINVHNPSIIVFLPPKDINTGVGMIVAPGGGHSSLWIMHEGFNPAQVLAEKGIAAFVLKNRLQSSGYKFDVEGLIDMQRAIKVVRSRAAEWGVHPNKIGASGFSAGGELAELVALQHDLGKPDASDPIELHMYAKTGHGFGIRPERAGQSNQEWPVHLISFLRHTGFIK